MTIVTAAGMPMFNYMERGKNGREFIMIWTLRFGQRHGHYQIPPGLE